MKTRQQTIDVQVKQGAILGANQGHGIPFMPLICQVIERYSDRMTCDVTTPDGQKVTNVPVIMQAGLMDGEPYGNPWLPAIDDFVILMPIAYGTRKFAILGTIVPYLSNDFIADAVNSAGKQFTLKLLEEGKENHDKKIFKSGTTWEVEEDGTITIEVPTGTYIKIDEANELIHVEDPHGNIVVLDSAGMSWTDANGNTITGSSTGIALDDGTNTIEMKAAGVAINGTNLEVAP